MNCKWCGKLLTKAKWKEDKWFCTNIECGHYGLGIGVNGAWG